MADDVSEKELYEQARKRVEEKKGFYTHLFVPKALFKFDAAKRLVRGIRY